MSDRVEIRMSSELLGRLDEARGEVPRGTFIKRALESALDDGPGRGDRWVSPPSPVPTRAPVGEVLGSPLSRNVSLRDTWSR